MAIRVTRKVFLFVYQHKSSVKHISIPLSWYGKNCGLAGGEKFPAIRLGEKIIFATMFFQIMGLTQPVIRWGSYLIEDLMTQNIQMDT